ncbi:MAG: hypothetical protein QOD71_800 [Thermoleophilaceae bacterium]|jgi:hypothetical protein|nr:hypothetical protein [Thermoleophilaceae bacterium]
MVVVDAHVGGVPIEETVLGLLPFGWALIAGVHVAMRRLRQAMPSKAGRTRKEQP